MCMSGGGRGFGGCARIREREEGREGGGRKGGGEGMEGGWAGEREERLERGEGREEGCWGIKCGDGRP